MKKVNVLFLALVLMAGQALVFAGPASSPAAIPQTAASVVDQVLQLKKAGISDDIILAQLRKGKGVDLTTDDLIKLKTAGVSDEILRTITNPNAAPAAAPAPAAAAPAQTPAPMAVSSSSAAAPASQKKRVTIAPFKFSAPMNELQATFGTSDNIGTGIKAVMTEQLTQSGKLSVVESDLGFLQQEIALGNSGNVKAGSGPRMGQMQGADLALVGDVLVFGRDDQKKSAVGGIISNRTFGVLGGGNKSNKAVVVISYRLINVESREVILSAEARGESKREDKNMFGGLISHGLGVGGGVDMTSSNFAQTILGEAVIDCAKNLAATMLDKAMTIPTRFVDVQARVAAVAGSQVTINVGTDGGVQVGDVFEISKVLNEIKDPISGEVLDLQLEAVGQLTITDARPKIATGNYVGGTVANSYVARKKRS